jgi:hypothetical protein
MSSAMDQAKRGLIRKLFIKEKERGAGDFQLISPAPHPVRVLQRFSDTSYSCW